MRTGSMDRNSGVKAALYQLTGGESTDTKRYIKIPKSVIEARPKISQLNNSADLMGVAKCIHSLLLLWSEPYPNSEAQETFVASFAFALLAYSHLALQCTYSTKAEIQHVHTKKLSSEVLTLTTIFSLSLLSSCPFLRSVPSEIPRALFFTYAMTISYS